MGRVGYWSFIFRGNPNPPNCYAAHATLRILCLPWGDSGKPSTHPAHPAWTPFARGRTCKILKYFVHVLRTTEYPRVATLIHAVNTIKHFCSCRSHSFIMYYQYDLHRVNTWASRAICASSYSVVNLWRLRRRKGPSSKLPCVPFFTFCRYVTTYWRTGRVLNGQDHLRPLAGISWAATRTTQKAWRRSTPLGPTRGALPLQPGAARHHPPIWLFSQGDHRSDRACTALRMEMGRERGNCLLPTSMINQTNWHIVDSFFFFFLALFFPLSTLYTLVLGLHCFHLCCHRLVRPMNPTCPPQPGNRHAQAHAAQTRTGSLSRKPVAGSQPAQRLWSAPSPDSW